MGKKSESPLIDVIMAFINDINPSISSEDVKSLKEMLTSFINQEIDFEKLDEYAYPIIKSREPMQRIQDILSVSKEPLSEFSLEEEKLAGRRRSHSWSVSEDNRLIYAIHHDGFGDWSRVAAFVGNGRTRSQCSQRWHRTLDPRINKNNWSAEDDQKLIEAVQKYGVNTWTKVAKFIGARTDVQCRYRYLLISKHGKSYKLSSSDRKKKTTAPPKTPKPKKEVVTITNEVEPQFKVSDESESFSFDSDQTLSEFDSPFDPTLNREFSDSFWTNLFGEQTPYDFSQNPDIMLY